MKRSLKIKVCGMLHPENLEKVCSLEPDFVGYIFYPGSRRFVGDHPDPSIFSIPGKEIRRVGVFVNEEISTVRRIHALYRLDMVQLHGVETFHYCQTLKEAGIPVIKALKPDPSLDEKALGAYRDRVDYLLFDTPGKEHGGTGRKFDWSYLDGTNIPVPYFLSGGIGPQDTEAIGRMKHVQLFGLDVNSMFETAPGMKHIELLGQFIREIKA